MPMAKRVAGAYSEPRVLPGWSTDFEKAKAGNYIRNNLIRLLRVYQLKRISLAPRTRTTAFEQVVRSWPKDQGPSHEPKGPETSR